jgi:DNA-binding transcriptional LysR family regulator
VFRLGLVNGLAHAQLAEAIVAITARFPRVTVRLKSGWSADLAEQHRLSLLDAAVILSGGSRFYGAKRIGEERLVAIGAPDRIPAPEEDAESRWILSPEPCDARRALASRLAQENRPLIVVAEVEHAGLQMSLVREGAGLGLMPRRLLNRERPHGVTEVDAIGGGLRLDVLMLRSPHLGALTAVADAIESEIARLIADGK